jgi:hypothetical protein
MDSPNSSPDQKKEGEQQPSELPSLGDKDNPPVTSNHVLPLVCEMIWLQIFLLTIAALPCAT